MRFTVSSNSSFSGEEAPVGGHGGKHRQRAFPGPYFHPSMLVNITTQLGAHTYLPCRIKNLRNKSRYAQGLSTSPHSTPLLGAASKTTVSAYTFPVQVLVQDGTNSHVLTSANANELLNTDLEIHMVVQGFSDLTEFAYYTSFTRAKMEYAG